MNHPSQRLGSGLTLVLVALMVGAAELFHEREILFPEVTALAVGLWVAPRMPWQTTRARIFLCITGYAVLGVCIVRFLPVPLFVQALLGFCLGAAGLILTRTTFFPLLSAIVLPILLGTRSWIYPISAAILAGILVLSEWWLVRRGVRPAAEFSPPPLHFDVQLRLWIARLCVVAALAALALGTGVRFAMAPPLLVGFVELTAPDSPARTKPVRIAALVCFSGACGAFSRLCLSGVFGLPLTVSALVATAAVLLVMCRARLFFPPAAAIATLAMLVDASAVATYPFQIAAGVLLLTLCACAISGQRVRATTE